MLTGCAGADNNQTNTYRSITMDEAAEMMAEEIKAVGLPSAVSYSAGAYVCNDLFYSLLSHFDGSRTRVGFIHIPYSNEQGKEPSMDIEDVVRGLSAAIECMAIMNNDT